MNSTLIIFFVISSIIIVLLIFILVIKVSRNKKLALSIPPTRILNRKDLEAIQFLEIDGNLMVNLLLFKRLPKKKLFKSVWQFSNIDFQITSTYKSKRIIHHFYLGINGKLIEIVIPEIFLPYLKEGKYYNDKTIEILYRQDHFVLYSIKDLISYPSLHKKSVGESNFKRQPTKEELTAFSLSKWSSVWGLMPPIIFPLFILGIMDEGFGLGLVFLPFFLIIIIPLIKAYKKRKKYIESRKVHVKKGTIWFDNEKYVYLINSDELKLHRKWKKAIKSHGVPIENVEMEAFLHTYDNLNVTVCHKFQPIKIKSNTIKINEVNLPSTRGWGIPLLYLLAFLAIAINAPNYDIIIDPREIANTTKNHFFVVMMTLIWWVSIVASLYLLYLVIIRILGHYFNKRRM